MPEELSVLSKNDCSKVEIYENMLKEINALVNGESNLIANLSNITAAIKQTFNFFWIGFYLVDNKSEQNLILGPFQVSFSSFFVKFNY
jgi:L-methionine (R)-S-oxide reductase